MPFLSLGERPSDLATQQAAAAVGQNVLIYRYQAALRPFEIVAGQVLLTAGDLEHPTPRSNARRAMDRLLGLRILPIVNENDTVATHEIRFGDNDRLAALVAHLIDADRLVLLTDTAGLFTADPRTDTSASLIEEIVEFDQRLEDMAGGPGSAGGRGGMASKLAAAKIATWSGVESVIARSDRPDVLLDAMAGIAGVGTVFRPRPGRLPARKLWIAFALRSSGRIVVDDGARRALEQKQRSLLAAGVRKLEGSFIVDDAVEVVDEAGAVFAKGLVRWSSEELGKFAGRRTSELPDELPDEVIHRDDLVMVPR
jgi:glutamate 5-kinase